MPSGIIETVHNPADRRRDFIRVEGLSRTFGSAAAVAGVSLAVAEGEFFTLLGGSGCGKSTLLRMLAGLEAPDAGRIFIDGADVTDLPPYRRPVNMVFQSYALFPHLDVAGNIAFGLKQAGMRKAEIADRVTEALTLFELAAFARRRPDQLSGGQRQRVALARALIKRPRLLLLDEPLAALDRRLRERMAEELTRIQQQVGITFIMVTHDQEEALNLSTRIGVMRDGRLEQVGTPREIYLRPANRFVASFVGSVNLLGGRRDDSGMLDCVELGVGIRCPAVEPAQALEPCQVAIRPERIELTLIEPPADEAHNCVPGTLESVTFLGTHLNCLVRSAAGGTLLASVSAAGAVDALTAGTRVFARWPIEHQVQLPL